jgi:L-seryl-tRNA(Ser) seleniumtransferase
LKSDAFFRALRCDKLILTALQQTALLYLEHAGENAGGWQRAPLPLLQMLAMPEGELRSRAEKIAAALTDLPLRAAVGAGMSRCGGGTMPKSSLPSVTLDVFPRGASLPEFARRLREGTPPVIGYIADDRLKLDLRTVFPRQDEALVKAIRAAAS